MAGQEEEEEGMSRTGHGSLGSNQTVPAKRQGSGRRGKAINTLGASGREERPDLTASREFVKR